MVKGILEDLGCHYIVNEGTLALVNQETGEWYVEKIPEEMAVGFDQDNFTSSILKHIRSICKNVQEQTSSKMEKPCNDRFNLIIIDTTNVCNLRCRYCSVSAESTGDYLSLENLQKGLGMVFNLPNISSPLSIEFSGGEPLANYSLIVKAVNLIKEMASPKKIQIRFCIQTNGVLITPEIAQFLKVNRFSIGISLDGYSKWNLNRVDCKGVPVYEKVLRTIKLLQREGVDFSVLGVVYHPDQYEDFLDFAKEYSVKNFRLNTLAAIGRSLDEMKQSEFINKTAEQYISSYLRMAKKLITDQSYCGFKEANLEYFLWSLLDWQPHMCFRTPCGAGRNQIHLSTKGEFFPCQDWRSIKDACIGTVYENQTLSSMLMKSHRVQEMQKANYERYPDYCANCTWKMRCGVCARELYTEYRGLCEKIGLCQFYVGVYDSLLSFFVNYKNEVLSYLGVSDED